MPVEVTKESASNSMKRYFAQTALMAGLSGYNIPHQGEDNPFIPKADPNYKEKLVGKYIKPARFKKKQKKR